MLGSKMVDGKFCVATLKIGCTTTIANYPLSFFLLLVSSEKPTYF
jgi:hypothetical protein